jgi:predicted cobalt transporter CbtA
MTSKRVYFLGAGSSKGHSKGIFPSLAGFFTTAKQLGLGVNPEFERVLRFATKD